MSAETDAIIQYMKDSGVPHRVTSIMRPNDSTSRHSKGLAVDFAGPRPGRNTPELAAIFNALMKTSYLLFELIYSPAGYSIKSGRRVARYAVADHYDHVHVSVNRGVLLRWPKTSPQPTPPPLPKVAPMYDPPLAKDQGIAAVWQTADGAVLAAVTPNGDVYAWGVPYAGDVSGKPYWGDRKAARIGPRDDDIAGYMITSTEGHTYRLPDGLG